MDAVRMFGEIINIADIKTVHMGGDLDGAPIPEDMKDITSIPKLFADVKSEYSISDSDMEFIRKENVKRILKNVWK